MAFTNGLSERMGELRFPNPRSPNDEVPFSGYASPPRGQNPFFSPFQSSASDTRGSLQRRFTTDSSKMSALTGVGGQNPQMVKSHFSASVRCAPFIFRQSNGALSISAGIQCRQTSPSQVRAHVL
jgi:hypothetical protein